MADPDADVTIRCPKCSEHLVVRRSELGLNIECHRCRTMFNPVAMQAAADRKLAKRNEARARRLAEAEAARRRAREGLVRARPATPKRPRPEDYACPNCGYDGAVILRWKPWVIPYAVIFGLLMFGLGLLILLAPRYPHCGRCLRILN